MSIITLLLNLCMFNAAEFKYLNVKSNFPLLSENVYYYTEIQREVEYFFSSGL